MQMSGYDWTDEYVSSRYIKTCYKDNLSLSKSLKIRSNDSFSYFKSEVNVFAALYGTQRKDAACSCGLKMFTLCISHSPSLFTLQLTHI